MIKEMRLKGIKTIKEANKFLIAYLPAYAKRFSVKPDNDTNLHRPIPKGINLDKIFCIKTARTLRNDFTVAHNGKLYQIEDTVGAKDVVVEERVNGSMLITYKEINLRFKEITARRANFSCVNFFCCLIFLIFLPIIYLDMLLSA